jgi:hypothetical protein
MRFRQLALSLGWSLLFWISFAVMLAGEDRVRLAQRNIHTGYWTLVLVDSAGALRSLFSRRLSFISSKNIPSLSKLV